MALISVTISGNAGPLRNALNDSESRLAKFGGALGKFAKIGAAAFAAAGAAAVVMGAKLIKAGEAAATANARIEQISKSMGLFGDQASVVSDRLVKLAEKTALQVGVDQNIIKSTQAKLLTFAELAKTADTAGGSFDRATKAALDLAAAGFGEASQNAVQLGKALQDPIKGITALARSGVTFTEAEKDRIRTLVESNKIGEAQALILEAIEKQVGGTAEATANASDKIRVALSQVFERLGQTLLPLFERFSVFLIETVFPTIEELANRVMPHLSAAFEAVGGFIQDRIVPIIQDFLIPAFLRIREVFLESIVPAIKMIAVPIFEGLVRIFDLVVTKVRENRAQFSQYFEALRGVWQFIRDKVAPVLAVTLRAAFEIAAKAIGFLLDGFFKILPIFTSVVNGVVRIASRMVDVIVGMVNGVISAVNLLVRGFNALPSVLRFGVELSEIPKISLTGTSAVGGAIGGDSSGPSYGMFPGAGTVVSPIVTGGITGGGVGDDGGGGTGGGGRGSRAKPESTNVTVNVNGALATKAEIGDAVIQAIRASNAIYGPFIASAF